MSKRTCSVSDCDKASRKRGWCDMHYWRWRRTGTTDAPPTRLAPVLERFEKPDGEDGCWLWSGYRNAKGYGQAEYKSRTWRAHRLVYTLLVGPVPSDLELDHLCKVTSCVNPAHLEPVTGAENMRRRYSA